MKKIINIIIDFLLKINYPNNEDKAMALLCEGAKTLEVSEVAKGITVNVITIERDGADLCYHVHWE